jgi:hypothetical protein
MPNDYTDPELSFPRLQAKIFTIDGDTYLLTIWLWEEAGVRRAIMGAKPAGTIGDAHIMIQDCAKKYGAHCDPEDIDVELES